MGASTVKVLRLMTVFAAVGLCACANYSSSMPGANQTAVVTGTWNAVFAVGSTMPTTTLTINFSQNGNSLNGTVTAVNNPSGSCFPAIASTGTSFTVTGQVTSAASSNLNVSVGFVSGSSNGTIMGTGSLAYLGTSASGTFSFPSGASGCTSGTFT